MLIVCVGGVNCCCIGLKDHLHMHSSGGVVRDVRFAAFAFGFSLKVERALTCMLYNSFGENVIAVHFSLCCCSATVPDMMQEMSKVAYSHRMHVGNRCCTLHAHAKCMSNSRVVCSAVCIRV
jgi:hypothetical protein